MKQYNRRLAPPPPPQGSDALHDALTSMVERSRVALHAEPYLHMLEDTRRMLEESHTLCQRNDRALRGMPPPPLVLGGGGGSLVGSPRKSSASPGSQTMSVDEERWARALVEGANVDDVLVRMEDHHRKEMDSILEDSKTYGHHHNTPPPRFLAPTLTGTPLLTVQPQQHRSYNHHNNSAAATMDAFTAGGPVMQPPPSTPLVDSPKETKEAILSALRGPIEQVLKEQRDIMQKEQQLKSDAKTQANISSTTKGQQQAPARGKSPLSNSTNNNKKKTAVTSSKTGSGGTSVLKDPVGETQRKADKEFRQYLKNEEGPTDFSTTYTDGNITETQIIAVPATGTGGVVIGKVPPPEPQQDESFTSIPNEEEEVCDTTATYEEPQVPVAQQKQQQQQNNSNKSTSANTPQSTKKGGGGGGKKSSAVKSYGTPGRTQQSKPIPFAINLNQPTPGKPREHFEMRSPPRLLPDYTNKPFKEAIDSINTGTQTWAGTLQETRRSASPNKKIVTATTAESKQHPRSSSKGPSQALVVGGPDVDGEPDYYEGDPDSGSECEDSQCSVCLEKEMERSVRRRRERAHDLQRMHDMSASSNNRSAIVNYYDAYQQNALVPYNQYNYHDSPQQEAGPLVRRMVTSRGVVYVPPPPSSRPVPKRQIGLHPVTIVYPSPNKARSMSRGGGAPMTMMNNARPQVQQQQQQQQSRGRQGQPSNGAIPVNAANNNVNYRNSPYPVTNNS
eukprot:PhF_6_TR23307/c0_g1_i3/m.32902